MSNPIINRTFKTPIGQVVCGLIGHFSDIEKIDTKDYENGSSVSYRTSGHRIELIEFKISQPLYNGETVKDSNGWIWKIEKIHDFNEKLKLSCVLNNYPDKVVFDTAMGEHLDAIEASDDKWTLHIGTEDGEILNSRAKSNEGFPERLENKVGFYQSITKMLKEGFETEIPELRVGEQIHIQYLSAYDKKSPESVNTWLAVNEFKRELENWIGVW
ncbi:hypothetical protein KORDIASMS9_03400 [Kordia sp. SMS9]|uniref:hypothetical protein n=1 Tax=Kordia sp. SMS9 TaxID=2282170 RepID=UPI000E0DE939|nr:hypothetical protein [Kordia sp. SMS9]AXG71145.1 hypothetical protein KORDIASMS9_03400 [Kordia sp. SMS9]